MVVPESYLPIASCSDEALVGVKRNFVDAESVGLFRAIALTVAAECEAVGLVLPVLIFRLFVEGEDAHPPLNAAHCKTGAIGEH